MSDLGNTQYFKVKTGPEINVKDVLDIVYNAMAEKGYNPVNQIVGYIMSGDPTFITSHNNKTDHLAVSGIRARAGRHRCTARAGGKLSAREQRGSRLPDPDEAEAVGLL